jgi:hypothetical protein
VRGGNSGRVHASGVKTTVVLLVMASTRCVMYVSFSVVNIMSMLVPIPVYSFAVKLMSNDLLALTGLASVVDFVVYVTLIRDFRVKVLSLICCQFWSTSRHIQ